MIPIYFPESNIAFSAPEGLEESQCSTIPAFIGIVNGGSCDGVQQVIVAWKPTQEELDSLNNGAAVYLSCMGGLPAHTLTVSFEQARRVA